MIRARPAAGRRALAAALATALSVCGCTLIAPPSQDRDVPAGLAPRVELEGVPFFAQDAYQCGPATLAMALGYAGAPRTPQELQAQVYLPERRGSLQPEMLAATRRAGRIAYPIEPSLRALLQELAGGHPVVVLQNLGWDIAPQWHYAIVIGYAADPATIILRSGTQARLAMDRRAFEASWTKAGRWGFVALAPTQLPATAREDAYVAAAAVLERAAPEAAREAYRTALAQWPQDLVARIGLGNIAYGLHELPLAEREYRHAAQDHPDSGDAWNNLAQVLFETGHPAEARSAASNAVAIGGERRDAYVSTLQAIEAGAR